MVKQHRPGTDGEALAVRLGLAADPALAHVLVAPLEPRVLTAAEAGVPDDAARPLVSLWPLVEVLDPETSFDRPDALPWAEVGALAARLHRVHRAAGHIPPAGTAARLARALTYLDDAERAGADLAEAARAVRSAARTLPESRSVTTTLVHGDLHLGQLARVGGGWRLIDIEDLGLGDPTDDLGRLAGFRAAGLLPDADWSAVLDGYRRAGGPAVPPDGDPWPALDRAAREAVVVAAAAALREVLLRGSRLDESGQALVVTCARIAGIR